MKKNLNGIYKREPGSVWDINFKSRPEPSWANWPELISEGPFTCLCPMSTLGIQSLCSWTWRFCDMPNMHHLDGCMKVFPWRDSMLSRCCILSIGTYFPSFLYHPFCQYNTNPLPWSLPLSLCSNSLLVRILYHTFSYQFFFLQHLLSLSLSTL